MRPSPPASASALRIVSLLRWPECQMQHRSCSGEFAVCHGAAPLPRNQRLIPNSTIVVAVVKRARDASCPTELALRAESILHEQYAGQSAGEEHECKRCRLVDAVEFLAKRVDVLSIKVDSTIRETSSGHNLERSGGPSLTFAADNCAGSDTIAEFVYRWYTEMPWTKTYTTKKQQSNFSDECYRLALLKIMCGEEISILSPPNPHDIDAFDVWKSGIHQVAALLAKRFNEVMFVLNPRKTTIKASSVRGRFQQCARAGRFFEAVNRAKTLLDAGSVVDRRHQQSTKRKSGLSRRS